MDDSQNNQHSAQVAAVAAAYLGNPSVQIEKAELGDVIRQIDLALRGPLEQAPAPEPTPELEKPSTAAVRKSVTPDNLISFIDGRPYKSLKRHLAVNGFTPKQYRERFGLKADYPMTAPAYSAHRSALAKKIGLGQMISNRAAAAAETPAASPVQDPTPQTPAPSSKRKVARKSPANTQIESNAELAGSPTAQDDAAAFAKPQKTNGRKSSKSKDGIAPVQDPAVDEVPSPPSAAKKAPKSRKTPPSDAAVAAPKRRRPPVKTT